MYSVFFFQAEDGIRDLVRSRGLGDVYKRQMQTRAAGQDEIEFLRGMDRHRARNRVLVIAGIVLLSLIHI